MSVNEGILADLTLRGLPDDLYRSLGRQDEANHRSIDRENIAIFERTMKGESGAKPRLSAAEIIEKARRFAARPVTDGRFVVDILAYAENGLPK